MHPTMMMTLANEVAKERQNERQKFQLRSQAAAARDQDSSEAQTASGVARRFIASVSLRPRLS